MTAVLPPLPVAEPAEGAEVLYRPFPGFQERCFRSSADELLLGGAKGPGKTSILLRMPLRWCHKPMAAMAFVRESFKELARPLDEAHRFYATLPAAYRPAWTGHNSRFTWPSGAILQFGYARTLADITWSQGGNWSHVFYDEVGNQPDEKVVNGLISEIRCPDPTIQRQFVGSANPGFAGHPWVKRRYIVPCGKQGERIAWSRFVLPSGQVVHRSKQFVPGRVTDNPIYANDPQYMATLMSLPDRMRRCLLDGDWDAASGLALDELNPNVHLVPPFEPPEHWPWVAAFDWGFVHWSVFMYGRVSDDGRVFVMDTIKRRLLRDWDLAGTLLEAVPHEALRVVHAGHDCWHEHRAHGGAQANDNTKTTADYFLEQGISLTKANIARASGYRTMLQYLAWQETPFLPQRQPMVQFMDTPGNRWLVEEHLSSMVMDPDDPTDVLKVDADSEDGAGGDDGYDCARYLLASRPISATSLSHLVRLRPSSEEVLRRQAAEFGRLDSTKLKQKSPKPMVRD